MNDDTTKEIVENILAHHGVKGMKWGVRRGRARSLKGFGPDKLVRKTKSGEIFTVERNPPSLLHKTMSALSKKYTENYKESAFLTIKDKHGKKIGEGSFWVKDKDDIYFNWLEINKSARGKGYATEIVKSVQELARQSGKKRVLLEVPGNSPDARHIYEKLGFEVTKVHEVDPVWGGLTEMEYRVPKGTK